MLWPRARASRLREKTEGQEEAREFRPVPEGAVLSPKASSLPLKEQASPEALLEGSILTNWPSERDESQTKRRGKAAHGRQGRECSTSKERRERVEDGLRIRVQYEVPGEEPPYERSRDAPHTIPDELFWRKVVLHADDLR